MIVTSVAVAVTNFLFDTCDCTIDSGVNTFDFSLMLGILHACGYGHVRSHVFPGMYCIIIKQYQSETE